MDVGGIYVPDIEGGCAEFLSNVTKAAPLAKVFVEIRDLIAFDGVKYDEDVITTHQPCIWYLVERFAEKSQDDTAPTLPEQTGPRAAAHEPCPESGNIAGLTCSLAFPAAEQRTITGMPTRRGTTRK